MINPYEIIDERLSKIENLLLDIKHHGTDSTQTNVERIRLNGDKAAAVYLGCTPLTIHKLRKEKAITYHRYGTRYYYYTDELDRDLRHDARRFGELRGRRAK